MWTCAESLATTGRPVARHYTDYTPEDQIINHIFRTYRIRENMDAQKKKINTNLKKIKQVKQNSLR